ncbi:MAG: hypothetical protein C4527_00720 [Candidatus Omnitrophota bacterium]|jgi:hypothetical protein|nr:MAG: hypothetical protein C4527_00720 [Candidatus Omnitrophota bacterium]
MSVQTKEPDIEFVKNELHALIEMIPKADMYTAIRFLRYLVEYNSDPLLVTLASAPIDNELSTPEEEAELLEAKNELDKGELFSLEEVKVQLLGDD